VNKLTDVEDFIMTKTRMFLVIASMVIGVIFTGHPAMANNNNRNHYQSHAQQMPVQHQQYYQSQQRAQQPQRVYTQNQRSQYQQYYRQPAYVQQQQSSQSSSSSSPLSAITSALSGVLGGGSSGGQQQGYTVIQRPQIAVPQYTTGYYQPPPIYTESVPAQPQVVYVPVYVPPPPVMQMPQVQLQVPQPAEPSHIFEEAAKIIIPMVNEEHREERRTMIEVPEHRVVEQEHHTITIPEKTLHSEVQSNEPPVPHAAPQETVEHHSIPNHVTSFRDDGKRIDI
jgi:hypothetical protein